MPENNSSSSFSIRKARTYLYGGLAALSLIAVLTLVAAFAKMHQQVEERAVTTAENLANSISGSLDNMLDLIDVSLQSSVDEIELLLVSGKEDRLSITAGLIKHQIRLNHGNVQIRATNEVGDIVYGTGVASSIVNVADRQRFIQHRDNPNLGLFIDEPVFARIDKEWIWVFTRRFNKPDGSFGGIVYAVIPVSSINQMLKEIKLDAGSVISLRDKQMRLVTRYAAPETFTASNEDKGLSESLSNALKATTSRGGSYISSGTKFDGQKRINAFHRNEEFGFLLNVGIAHDTAYAAWWKNLWVAISLFLTFIGALVLCVQWIIRALKRQEQNVAALVESESSLIEVQQVARLGHYVYDVRADVWTSSDVMDEIFGIGPDYPRTGKGWLELVVPESREEMGRYLKQILQDHLPFDNEYDIIRHVDGQRRHVNGKGMLQLDKDGMPSKLVGAIQDITERMQTEMALRESHETYQSILETTLDGFWCMDVQGKLLDVNQAYCQQSGYTLEELLAMHVTDLEAMMNQSEIENHIESIFKHGAEQFETQHRRKDGSIWDVEISTTYRYFAGGRIFVFVRDISDRKLQQHKLEQLATTDGLTGLINRRYFYNLAQTEIKRALRFGRPLSIAMVDIDRFKHINDTYGHASGDVVLKTFAEIMLQDIREIDVFARLGGDEFALLLPAASPEQAYEVLERIRLKLIARQIDLADKSVSITLSAGIAGMLGEEDTLDALMHRSDQALYKSKEAGRNRITIV